jgi:hypothetical protein
MMIWPANAELYPRFLRSPIRKGMGIGEGAGYRAWRNLRERPTSGTAAIVCGIRVQRNYELLNDAAKGYFFILERKSEVIDIRERWPILDLRRTLQLTSEYDVKHPYRGKYPEPLLFDFLVTEQNSTTTYKAINLISRADALNQTTRTLMLIRQQWCRERGIAWTLVESAPISRTVIQGLRFIRQWHLNTYVPNSDISERFSRHFLIHYKQNVVLKELVETTGRSLRLRPDARLDAFRYCAWKGLIPVSLTHRLACNAPLVLDCL